jgi:hypothetical protein
VSNQVYRRCGCRDDSGKQLGQKCPQLKSDPKHGSWAYYLSHGSDPRTGQRVQLRKAGFKTKRAAESAVAKLRASLDAGTYSNQPRSPWLTTPPSGTPGAGRPVQG